MLFSTLVHLYSILYMEWSVIPRTNDMFYFKLVSKLFIDTFLALKTYSQGEGDIGTKGLFKNTLFFSIHSLLAAS